MAHMIDMTSRASPSMAFAASGGACWHGLGHALPEGADLETWIKAAGLDWECEVIPSQYMFRGNLMTADDAFHMVRGDTGASLGVMSSRYNPHQPAEVMAFFRDFILTDPRFQMETAGVLKGGKVIWGLAKFSELMDVNGDKHVCYVLLTTSFNGSLATTAQATMIRVVCKNTLNASLMDKKAMVKVPHYQDFSKPAVKADAHERLASVAHGFSQYKAVGEALMGIKIGRDALEGFFKDLTIGKTKPDPKTGKHSLRALGQLDTILGAYKATLDEGTDAATGWSAFNAVTRYVDHERHTRNNHAEAGGSAGDSRLASAWFGSGAGMKEQALTTLAGLGGLNLQAIAANAPQTLTTYAPDPMDILDAAIAVSRPHDAPGGREDAFEAAIAATRVPA